MATNLSPITHFPNYSVITPDLKIKVNLSKYDAIFQQAQQWLGNKVLEDCKPLMPIDTGNLHNSAYVDNNGRRVVFSGVYARFQYMGKVMVDPVTGSPWARRGAKKVVTDRPLNYKSPQATLHWFDVAKERYGDFWVAGVKKITGGR